MSAKKNPLYVVKKDHVEEATNLVDLVVKKFNLDPLIELLQSILSMLMESVTSYAALAVVNEYIEEISKRLKLFKDYSIV